MIAHIEGVLREVAPTRVVVDVAGVGYELHIPLSTFTELPDLGSSVALHVHTHAREGALQLFGFHSAAERTAFDLLLRASRVGPKLAQTILSGITPMRLLDAIHGGDIAVLRATPGIGTRMAERILVELRDRTGELAAVVGDGGVTRRNGGDAGLEHSQNALREQTLSALMNLGYPKARAERALEAAAEAAEGAPTLEDLVRGSLRSLSR